MPFILSLLKDIFRRGPWFDRLTTNGLVANLGIEEIYG